MYAGSEFIKKYIPGDHSRQTSIFCFTDKILNSHNVADVLDLGCGDGSSISYFKQKNPNIVWKGVDIESSPEVDSRKQSGDDFITYDGVNIPLKENSMDLIFCRQVLEHVKRPIDLLKESARVLKSGGYFIGSTSHLEAFHSLSICNYTPYGLEQILKETNSGFNMLEIRPGIDFLSLFIDRLLSRISFCRKITRRWFNSESPGNIILSIFGKIAGKSPQELNLIKLLFCGHFIFCLKKH